MAPDDFAALENAEFEAGIDLFRAAPEAARVAHDVEVRDIGAATCLTCRGAEPAAVFRRALRLGVGKPTSESEIDEVLAHMNGRGLQYAVPVAPQARPAALTHGSRRGDSRAATPR